MDRVGALLLFFAAALAAVLYKERAEGLFAPPPPPEIRRGAASVLSVDLDPAPPAAATGHNAGAFTEMLDRPLFEPGRRPAAAAASAPPRAAPSLAGRRLAGAVRVEGRWIAVIETLGRPRYQRLGAGETLEGWRLTAVDEGRALFEREQLGGTLERVVVDRDGARPAEAR